MKSIAFVCVAGLLPFALIVSGHAEERREVSVRSTLDGTNQPCHLVLPDGFQSTDNPRPLLVSLHSWSADLNQRRPGLEAGANKRGWIFLAPNFRGPNNAPDACGSPKAQQDVLDAVAWARKELPIDDQRIYLTGASGGGHMTMLMVGRHPEPWAAASAWVGISDLRTWHQKHRNGRYGDMIRNCCGGAPGASPQVDAQYRDRSPITWIHRAVSVPLDISAGIHDGHTGSVPIRHSIDAFNRIAHTGKHAVVSKNEIEQLSLPTGRLKNPLPSDQVTDATFGRDIYLRRRAGPVRLTIFEGGHETIDSATLAWLARHVKGK